MTAWLIIFVILLILCYIISLYDNIYIYIYIYTYISLSLSLSISLSLYIYICIHICICVYICVYIYIYVSLSLSVYIYIYIYIHYTHIPTYICTYVHASMQSSSWTRLRQARRATTPGLGRSFISDASGLIQDYMIRCNMT